MTAMTAATRNNRPKVPVDIFALLTLHASITPNAGDEDRFIGAELDEESGDLIFLTITYGPGEGPGENYEPRTLRMPAAELNPLIRCLEALRDRAPLARVAPEVFQEPVRKRHLRRA